MTEVAWHPLQALGPLAGHSAVSRPQRKQQRKQLHQLQMVLFHAVWSTTAKGGCPAAVRGAAILASSNQSSS